MAVRGADQGKVLAVQILELFFCEINHIVITMRKFESIKVGGIGKKKRFQRF